MSEEKPKYFNIRMGPELRTALEKKAAEDYRSLSSMIRLILEKHLEIENPKG